LDQTPVKTLVDIKNEYNVTCGQAGEAQFKMKALEAELFELNKKLVALHQEYNTAAKAEEAKKEEKDV
jgi:hypothetical protein